MVILSHGAAWGAEWIKLTETSSCIEFVDRSSIAYRPEGTVRVWLKFQYNATRKYEYDMALWEIDCNERRVRVVSWNTYSYEGSSTRDPISTGWTYPPPESRGMFMTEILCDYLPKIMQDTKSY